ncbi:hypothetical protein [Burkholderia gladioli]|uniref:hypothetical protein n=1 Tax=Burkholderia gladioli TaxID=28095 RepID=UPI001641BF12|nr:hypothetical protein [Burkholderia gladioli]
MRLNGRLHAGTPRVPTSYAEILSGSSLPVLIGHHAKQRPPYRAAVPHQFFPPCNFLIDIRSRLLHVRMQDISIECRLVEKGVPDAETTRSKVNSGIA